MIHRFPPVYGLLAFFSLILTFLAHGQVNPIEKYHGIEPIRHADNPILEGWVDHFFSPEDCRCVFGDEFFISTYKPKSVSKDLIITLEPGGACWPGLESCKTKISTRNIYSTKFGRDLASRMGGNWNQLFIPYCDGSVYLGDNAADYDGDGRVDHWHWGLRNAIAGINLASHEFKDMERVIITGCSAGGVGTITLVRWVRQIYPNARIYIINESGPGIFAESKEDLDVLINTWGFGQLIPNGDCRGCDEQLVYWYMPILRDPKVKVSLYSSYYDRVMAARFLHISQKKYKDLLLQATDSIHKDFPDRFNRFFVDSDSHCVKDRDHAIDGVTYWNWILAFLRDDENWTDALE